MEIVKVNPNVHSGLGLTIMYACKCMHFNKCATMEGDGDKQGGYVFVYVCVCTRTIEGTGKLYFSLNFAVNTKLLFKSYF